MERLRHRHDAGRAAALPAPEPAVSGPLVLMDGKTAAAVLTDAPDNVKIAGNVSGLGAPKHGECKMASGEMSQAQFADFLGLVLKPCADRVSSGAGA